MSERTLRRALLGLAALGLAIAGYLTYVHYAGVPPVCTAGGGCEKVQTSHWAKLSGVPVAVIGLAGYAAILAALALPGEAARMTATGLAVAGAGFSAYLTYLELFDIHAICQWCVASAVVMAALAVLALVRTLRAEDEEPTRLRSAGAPGPEPVS